MNTDSVTKIEQVVQKMQQANSLLFITGAGISAASGLPTYRGIGGLYNDRLTEDNIPIEVALSGMMMHTQPEITWTYIAKIEAACRGASFNPAHQIIARMEAHFERVWVLTQNVDGFHRAAGSHNIIDIHGDIHHLYCPHCAYRTTVGDYRELAIPPTCPDCGQIIRPDVVLFGEMLDRQKVERLMTEIERGFDLIFSIGTTSLFPYIAEPVIAATAAGVPTVEINPTDTEVSEIVSIRLQIGAVEALRDIWSRYQDSQQ